MGLQLIVVQLAHKFLGTVETDACGSQEKTANRRRYLNPLPSIRRSGYLGDVLELLPEIGVC
jgi:hypothetical protein